MTFEFILLKLCTNTVLIIDFTVDNGMNSVTAVMERLTPVIA